MGAWGWGPFDNDDALDWCVDLESLPEGERPGFVRSTLRQTLDWEGYLPDDVGQPALAAATLVALHRSKGAMLYGVQEIPDVVISLVSADLNGDLHLLALSALDRVEKEGESAWRSLWGGSELPDDIVVMLDDLRSALQ